MKRFCIRSTFLGLIAITLSALSSSTGLVAQATTIEFAVPPDTPVTTGAGEDVVVFTGRPLGTIESVGDCGSFTNGAVQNVVAIHPNAGHSNHFTVIVIDHSEPIHPGTKLTDITGLGFCTISGSTYSKYQGTVN